MFGMPPFKYQRAKAALSRAPKAVPATGDPILDKVNDAGRYPYGHGLDQRIIGRGPGSVLINHNAFGRKATDGEFHVSAGGGFSSRPKQGSRHPYSNLNEKPAAAAAAAESAKRMLHPVQFDKHVDQ